MTKDRLRQIDDLYDEIREEQDRLEREERHARRMEKWFGVGNMLGNDALREARCRVREALLSREDEIADVRSWIETVSDSMTRRALKLRYLDGLAWSDVARRMGYADESGPRKLVERLLLTEKGA